MKLSDIKELAINISGILAVMVMVLGGLVLYIGIPVAVIILVLRILGVQI